MSTYIFERIIRNENLHIKDVICISENPNKSHQNQLVTSLSLWQTFTFTIKGFTFKDFLFQVKKLYQIIKKVYMIELMSEFSYWFKTV